MKKKLKSFLHLYNMKQFVNDFQSIVKQTELATELVPINIENYNSITLFNTTVNVIAWGTDTNRVNSYSKAICYRGNENELSKGILNIYFFEKIVGFPTPAATLIKKRYI